MVEKRRRLKQRYWELNLKEFFSQLASPVQYKKQIGVYIPVGAVHLLGTQLYAILICNNNVVLSSVTTIPLGNFQHATLDIPFPLILPLTLIK